MNALRYLLLAFAVVVGSTAWASPVEDAQRAELDRARGEIGGQIQLSAYDLVDELVWGWVTDPVFEDMTPVVLASVTVPVGLGTGMQALLENHIGAVIGENPKSHVQLVHCPTCSAVVVHSGPEGTVVSRGIDNPEALAELGGATGKHALFIDIEAEGTWLVLRARLTRLTPDLPIVWSHTVTSSAGTPALLREPSDLKSASDAHKEYLDALRSRGPVTIPVRFVIRTYAQPRREEGTPPPPFLWLQSGVEIGATEARAWTSSLLLGISFVPQAYQGVMVQGRVNRLITGRSRSLTRPDLYLFAGGALMNVWGPAAVGFQLPILTGQEVLLNADLEAPRTMFGGFHLGLDLRVGNRIGFSVFLEQLPSLRKSRNIGDYIRPFGFGFQSLGLEVTACF